MVKVSAALPLERHIAYAHGSDPSSLPSSCAICLLCSWTTQATLATQGYCVSNLAQLPPQAGPQQSWASVSYQARQSTTSLVQTSRTASLPTASGQKRAKTVPWAVAARQLATLDILPPQRLGWFASLTVFGARFKRALVREVGAVGVFALFASYLSQGIM